jgi:hypothetical protein
MNERELYQEVARATGETVGTIDRLGFVPLETAGSDREPRMIDWDEPQEAAVDPQDALQNPTPIENPAVQALV